MASELTLAVDIGTGYTSAAITVDGRSRSLTLGGWTVAPSTVALDPAGRLVAGPAATAVAASAPDRALARPLLAFERGQSVRLGDGEVPTSELVSTLLRWVADEAAGASGGARVTTLVLTAPVRWTSAEIQRLREAASRAGLPEPLLVPEPVAAARWHASLGPIPAGSTVAVYDLGDTSLTATVLSRRGDGFEIIGEPGGSSRIGGDSVDEALLRTVADRLRGSDPRAWESIFAGTGPASERLLAQARQAVRQAKENLSSTDSAPVALPNTREAPVLRGPDVDAAADGPLRASVDELVRVIEATGLRPGEAGDVLLAGGSSQLALVPTLIGRAVGRAPRSLPEPKAAIPLGALLTVGALGTLDSPLRAGGPVGLNKATGDEEATRLTGGQAAGLGAAAGAGLGLAAAQAEAPTELAGNSYPPPGQGQGYGPPGGQPYPTPPHAVPANQVAANQFPPPGGNTPPQYGNTPPPYGNTPPRYGNTPPPYGNTPPPYGNTPPQYGNPPPGGPGGGYPQPAGNAYGPPPGPGAPAPGYQGYPGYPTAPVPPTPPRRRRTGLIAAIAVVVVLAIAIPVIILSTSSGSKHDNASPTPSPSVTLPTTAPTSAAPTFVAPTTPSLTTAEISLQDQLDPTALSDCLANPGQEGTNVSASLICQADDGRQVTALQYRSLTAHNSDVSRRSQGVPDVGDCTDGVTSVETWHYNSAPNTPVGSLICSRQNGNFVVFWTYKTKLLGFVTQDADPTTVTEFWKKFEAVAQ